MQGYHWADEALEQGAQNSSSSTSGHHASDIERRAPPPNAQHEVFRSKSSRTNSSQSSNSSSSVVQPTLREANLLLHERGECKPCQFLSKPLGCLAGDNCTHCHFVHETVQKPCRPGKSKRNQCKRVLDALDMYRVDDPVKYKELCERLSSKYEYFRVALHNRIEHRARQIAAGKHADDASVHSFQSLDRDPPARRKRQGDLERALSKLIAEYSEDDSNDDQFRAPLQERLSSPTTVPTAAAASSSSKFSL